MTHIANIDKVRQILGVPNELTYRKIKPRLNSRMVSFIKAAPLMMLATVDKDGFPTVSPKGDHPGFVGVRDDETLLIPERKGNKLAFSFQNILEHPKVGLIFMVPGTTETLRIHGECRVIHDPALEMELASATQEALLVIELKISSCYFHCAKAFLRSKAWVAESWGPRQYVSFGEEIFGPSPDQATEVAQLDSAVMKRYETDI
jgi:PPOX class probable FMN-dependent enzyme